MFVKSKMLIKNNTQIADRRREWDGGVIDSDGLGKRGVIPKFLVSEKHKFGLTGIDMELVASKPVSEITDAKLYL